jgi:hypothetical protein
MNQRLLPEIQDQEDHILAKNIGLMSTQQANCSMILKGHSKSLPSIQAKANQVHGGFKMMVTEDGMMFLTGLQLSLEKTPQKPKNQQNKTLAMSFEGETFDKTIFQQPSPNRKDLRRVTTLKITDIWHRESIQKRSQLELRGGRLSEAGMGDQQRGFRLESIDLAKESPAVGTPLFESPITVSRFLGAPTTLISPFSRKVGKVRSR